jgi:hypothetical protein
LDVDFGNRRTVEASAASADGFSRAAAGSGLAAVTVAFAIVVIVAFAIVVIVAPMLLTLAFVAFAITAQPDRKLDLMIGFIRHGVSSQSSLPALQSSSPAFSADAG